LSLHIAAVIPALSILSYFNDPPTTHISTLSLHDALPISPASPIDAGLAPPYGATRTGVAALRTIARGCARRRTSRAASPAAATVTSESPRMTVRRRRAATAIHRATQQSPAPSAHSPGVARPVVRSASLAASGAGRSSRARRTWSARGASRAALAQAAVALPSAPARYNVAPRLYQCAGTRGSPAARAANESAAARRAPASYSASALSV